MQMLTGSMPGDCEESIKTLIVVASIRRDLKPRTSIMQTSCFDTDRNHLY
jgi:hypothetical protein